MKNRGNGKKELKEEKRGEKNPKEEKEKRGEKNPKEEKEKRGEMNPNKLTENENHHNHKQENTLSTEIDDEGAVLFTLTPLAVEFLGDLVAELEKSERVDKEKYLGLMNAALRDGNYSFKSLKFIYNDVYLPSKKIKNEKRIFIHELLKDSKLSHKTEPLREKNPELEMQLRKAKARAANVQYFKLVKGIIPPKQRMKLEDNRAMREGLKAAVLPLNILFSTVGVFLFFFYACRWLGVSLGKSFVIGLVAGFVLLFLEVALLFLRSRKQVLKESKQEQEETDSKYNVFFEPQYRGKSRKPKVT